jgi:cell wall-associated NlpC family hydrolase
MTCCAPQKNNITYTVTTLPQKGDKKPHATPSSKKQTTPTSSSSSNLSSISKKLGINVTKSDNQKLYSEAASWIGTKYKYGGTSKSGVDCSGFTYLMYKSVYGKTLSRQSEAILNNNCKRISKNQLKEGDLVFFRTDGKKSSNPNHVGIYLKNNKFIHASSSKGVVVSDITTDYYVKNWIAGGRVK